MKCAANITEPLPAQRGGVRRVIFPDLIRSQLCSTETAGGARAAKEAAFRAASTVTVSTRQDWQKKSPTKTLAGLQVMEK
jgi:hypothetical protein